MPGEYDGVQDDDEEDDQLRGRVQDDRADFLPPYGRGRLSHDACQVGGGCICGQAGRSAYARPNKEKAQRAGFLRGVYCINFFRRPAWIGAV